MRGSPSIGMGEWAVAMEEGVLRTLLGSCIGLVLYDRAHKVAGLAHMVLPWSNGVTEIPGKFVDTAVPVLVREMTQLVGPEIRPTARIAGGANMFSTEAVRTIGEQNIEASERVLDQIGIPIVGRHCGGEQGRRVSVDIFSGIVTIEMVGGEPIQLHDTPIRSRALHG